MMIRKMIFAVAMAVLSVVDASAYAVNTAEKFFEKMMKESVTERVCDEPVMKPTYVDGAFLESWRYGWFVGVQGGAAAFIGTPLGCDDLFGRSLPAVNVSLGRWHTPRVANRLVYQGWQWKSGALERQNYHHYHADLMINLLPSGRFDLVPLIGVGLIHNAIIDVHPFAINYGIQGRWRVLDRMHITAELSNATTFANADGIGSPNRFGDNLLSLTAGVSWNFGKNARFKRVEDARPYMAQNTRLHARVHDLSADNDRLKRESAHALAITAELRKILDLEGLLDKYAGIFYGDSDSIRSGSPVNDYSGLTSLRKRLADGLSSNKSKGKEIDLSGVRYSSAASLDTIYNSVMVGAPIYFFFELNSDELVAKQQLVNIDAIARVAKNHGLHIKVIGAADVATGSPELNTELARSRAERIAGELTQRGIDPVHITIRALGGIADYTPDEANRQCIVTLHIPNE